MALQGRKPGWLLDKILGREAEPEVRPSVPPVPPASFVPPRAEPPQAEPPRTEPEPILAPPVLSPASVPEGQPDFMPAAAPPGLVVAPPGVTEASPETPADMRPVEPLGGASLQPVADRAETAVPPGAASPSGLTGPGRAEEPPEAASRATHDRAASVEAPLRPAPRDDEAMGGRPPTAPAVPEPDRKGWWSRLTEGMRRTSSAIGDSVTGLFTKKKLDRATLDDLEDVLIGADLGVETATRITQAVAGGRYDREISADEVKSIMAAEIEAVLAPVATPLVLDGTRRPYVILMVGVNGAGKTTTIGKLAEKFRRQGLSVVIAAGDTFRAAAIELKVWGERVGAPVIARQQGADAAGLAFDALQEARARGADVLLIDTAGRLQNKTGLMEELSKILRVIRKLDPEAPHASLLVLDATVGQNALSQVELFGKVAGVTGLVMTKLDGTARGGILVALAAKFGLPVHYIGVGEGVDDLEPFAARDFARAIAGLDEAA